MRIIGLIKVRNESEIIKDTLDMWGKFCEGGIYVYDDVSEDNTVEICEAHPDVKEVINGDFWDPDREKAEWFNRQMALTHALRDAGPNDWFVYFDADEHPYNFERFEIFDDPNVKAIAMKLWDCYITPDDVDIDDYKKREWFGPEFRTIIMFFRNSPYLRYHQPDQRIVTMAPDVGSIPIHGDIKHYGKGFSVQQWEDTCNYYIKWWPKYAAKWKKRKGKAVHKEFMSDFDNPLIKFKDRGKGFSLEHQEYGKN